MGWKAINNSEPDSRPHYFPGKCLRFNKDAIITIRSSGNICEKTDLQKTYHEASFTCSLLDGTPEASFSPCMKTCSLRPKYYL